MRMRLMVALVLVACGPAPMLFPDGGVVSMPVGFFCSSSKDVTTVCEAECVAAGTLQKLSFDKCGKVNADLAGWNPSSSESWASSCARTPVCQ